MTKKLSWAILDYGASSHFLISNAPGQNKEIATTPLHITLSNSVTVQSSHTANIALPQLPPMARIARIVPGLSSHSLIPVVKLCNAGCQAKITDITCKVHYRGKAVMQCSKCTTIGLWMIPLTNDTAQETMTPNAPADDITAQAHHMHQTSTNGETVQFYQQSLFSLPHATLLNAIKNHQLDTFPGLVPSLLKQLPQSIATAKGHMHRNHEGF